MGEVWRAQHRLLARPAAIKLIRPSLIEKGGDAERRAPALRARGAGHGAAAVAAHGGTLRLRRGRRRRLLLRDGAAGRPGPRGAGQRATGRCRPSAPFTCCARCATRWPRPSPRGWCTATSSRPTSSPAATAATTTSSRCWISASSRPPTPRRRKRASGLTSTMLLQGTPAFIAPEQALGGGRDRRPRRHLRHRLRRLLAADRAAGVHGRHGGRHHHASRAHRTHAAVATLGAADSAGARRAGAGLPGQGPRRPAADRWRTVAPPGEHRLRSRVGATSGPATGGARTIRWRCRRSSQCRVRERIHEQTAVRADQKPHHRRKARTRTYSAPSAQGPVIANEIPGPCRLANSHWPFGL